MFDDPIAEFDRQTLNLTRLITSHVLNCDLEKFQRQTKALRSKIEAIAISSTNPTGNIPVVLVVKQRLFPFRDLMREIVAKKRNGYVEMTPRMPEDFIDTGSLNIPGGDVYALLDVDTGKDILNVSPCDSVQLIEKKGRTVLTMREGIYCALAIPEILTDANRFNSIQMPGSRIEGDLRVPSIWFSKGAPRLGWCWWGNIHTWLATASVKSRIAID